MPLDVKPADDDTKIFDTVTLVGGVLRFETGASRSLFDNLKRTRSRLGKPITDAQAYAAFTGWNNGYVQIQERG
jgi:hypothetical protein